MASRSRARGWLPEAGLAIRPDATPRRGLETDIEGLVANALSETAAPVCGQGSPFGEGLPVVALGVGEEVVVGVGWAVEEGKVLVEVNGRLHRTCRGGAGRG